MKAKKEINLEIRIYSNSSCKLPKERKWERHTWKETYTCTYTVIGRWEIGRTLMFLSLFSCECNDKFCESLSYAEVADLPVVFFASPDFGGEGDLDRSGNVLFVHFREMYRTRTQTRNPEMLFRKLLLIVCSQLEWRTKRVGQKKHYNGWLP